MGTVRLTLVLLTLSFCVAVVDAHADVKDLGDICIASNDDLVLGRPPQIDRFGVLVYGANQQHIVLTGASYPSHGTAVITGGQILVTLNSSSVTVSGDVPVYRFWTTHMVISASTLSGRFTTMVTQTSPTQLSENVTGQVQVSPCP